MTAAILPPAETTYFDADGVPLALGSVTTYVPGTSTPKTTWQDAAKITANVNPTPLDAAGRCIMLGEGSYRTVVKDADGNTIWDQVTANSQISAAMLPIVSAATIPAAEGLWEAGITSGSAPAGAVLGQRWIDASVPAMVQYSIYDGAQWLDAAAWDTVHHVAITNGAMELTAPPYVATVPIGQAGQTIHVTGDITTSTIKTTPAEFGFSVNLTNTTGLGVSIATSGNKVAGYFATKTTATGGNAWSLNTVLLIEAGGGLLGAQNGYELDVANNSGVDFNSAIDTAGLLQPSSIGLQITALGDNANSTAIAVLGSSVSLGGGWAAGITFANNSINRVTILDENSPHTSYKMLGSYTYGIDMASALFSGGPIRIGSQQTIQMRNVANNADLSIIQGNASNQVLLGDGAAGVRMSNTVIILAGLQASTSYANDAAAAGGGVAVGQLYRNGSVVQIRIT